MNYITYNKDKISKLSLGTVQFGLNYGIANNGKPTYDNTDTIINYIIDNGINTFDTAQSYGDSEKILGNSIKNKKDIFIISKLASESFTTNLSENIDKSLSNLKINCMYALLLHDSKLLYNWEERYTKSITNLINKNKIKYFGVSIYTNSDFQLAIQNPNINFIQIPFNIFDQRAISKRWFQQAKEKNKLIFVRSIFLQGLLLMEIQDIPAKLKDAINYLKTFELYAKELNISKSELALSFVNSIATESLILFGCDSIKQAQENIENFNSLKQLDTDTIERIHKDFNNINENIYNPAKW